MDKRITEQISLNKISARFEVVMEDHLRDFLSRKMPSFDKNCTHAEFVERWAHFIKTHPRSVWKKEVAPLIDAQSIMAERFYAQLAKTPGGMEKIRKLREMRKRA